MANRARPRCPDCTNAMMPVYRKTPRGAIQRIPDTFHCATDDRLARGRRKVRFL